MNVRFYLCYNNVSNLTMDTHSTSRQITTSRKSRKMAIDVHWTKHDIDAAGRAPGFRKYLKALQLEHRHTTKELQQKYEAELHLAVLPGQSEERN